MSAYTPWNGLNILPQDTTVEQVANYPELTWDVETAPIYQVEDRMPTIIPNAQVLRRVDNHNPLSIVGGRYTPYQNSEMWSVIEQYCKVTGGRLYGAGIMGGNSNFVGASIKLACTDQSVNSSNGCRALSTFL